MKERLYFVQAGDPISADAYNRMVRNNNLALRADHAPQPDEYLLVAQVAEIQAFDTINRLLHCVEPGASEVFDVRLPELYTEASRDFGTPIGIVNYAYVDLNERNATGGSPAEQQFLTPPLVIGEIILVEFAAGTDDYVMVGDGRMWAVDPT